jgi:hypothetical protein
MSREQLTEQQTQHETAATDAGTQDQTHGLPPGAYSMVLQLKPGDARGLRDLLVLLPDFSEGILAVASSRLGLSTVQQAIKLATRNGVRPGALTQEQMRPGGEFELEGETPAARPGALTQAEMRPGGEFELEGSAPVRKGALTQAEMRPGGEFELEGRAPVRKGALTQAEMRPGGEFELEGSAPVRKGALTQAEMRPGGEFELEGSAPAKGPEPAWVGDARKYNDGHAGLVSDFNEATNSVCVVNGQLDPELVRKWQAEHGIPADGKVGPQTLAAARKAKARITSIAADAE